MIVENNYNFFAVLAYKNEIYAAFEHDITKLTPQTLQKIWKNFALAGSLMRKSSSKTAPAVSSKTSLPKRKASAPHS